MQVEYRVGDLVLYDRYGNLQELEIFDVSQSAKAVKTGFLGWQDAATFHENVRGKIGRVEYRRGIFGKRRIVTRT